MAVKNIMRKDLPMIKGAEICAYGTDEDGRDFCRVCGKKYLAYRIVQTYGTISNNELPRECAKLDLIGDETNGLNYMDKRIDEFDVYEVFLYLNDVYFDSGNGNMSPVGKIVGARKLEGYDKREIYGKLNEIQSRECVKVLKAAYAIKDRKVAELMHQIKEDAENGRNSTPGQDS